MHLLPQPEPLIHVHGTFATETLAEFQTGTSVSTLFCYITVSAISAKAQSKTEIWCVRYLLWFYCELVVEHLLILCCSVLNRGWVQHKGSTWDNWLTKQEMGQFCLPLALGEGKIHQQTFLGQKKKRYQKEPIQKSNILQWQPITLRQ